MPRKRSEVNSVPFADRDSAPAKPHPQAHLPLEGTRKEPTASGGKKTLITSSREQAGSRSNEEGRAVHS